MASLVAQMTESSCNAGDLGLVPGWGRAPGEGHGNPLQYSCLVNSMDRRARRATVHGVAESRTRLSDWHFHFHREERREAKEKGREEGRRAGEEGRKEEGRKTLTYRATNIRSVLWPHQWTELRLRILRGETATFWEMLIWVTPWCMFHLSSLC